MGQRSHNHLRIIYRELLKAISVDDKKTTTHLRCQNVEIPPRQYQTSVAQSVITFLEVQEFTIMHHPPYLPYLAPSDFSLFDCIKTSYRSYKRPKSNGWNNKNLPIDTQRRAQKDIWYVGWEDRNVHKIWKGQFWTYFEIKVKKIFLCFNFIYDYHYLLSTLSIFVYKFMFASLL